MNGDKTAQQKDEKLIFEWKTLKSQFQFVMRLNLFFPGQRISFFRVHHKTSINSFLLSGVMSVFGSTDEGPVKRQQFGSLSRYVCALQLRQKAK